VSQGGRDKVRARRKNMSVARRNRHRSHPQLLKPDERKVLNTMGQDQNYLVSIRRLRVDKTIESIICKPVTGQALKKLGRVSSKELLEEIGDDAPLLFLLAGGVGVEDGPAENDPPPILFLDRLQVQRFTTIEREGA
jgi:hypothetical protein